MPEPAPVPVSAVPVSVPEFAPVFVSVLVATVAAPVLVLAAVFEHGTFCTWPSEISWTTHGVLVGPLPVPMTVEIGVPRVVVVPSSTSPPPVAVIGSDNV